MSFALITRAAQSYDNGFYYKSCYRAVPLLEGKTCKQMFIATLFTVDNRQKQPHVYQLMSRYIKGVISIQWNIMLQ